MGGSPDFYLHIRTLISLVIGLSITHNLSGLASIVQHPVRRKLYAVHLIWAASLLLGSIHFWWWEFRLHELSWTFGRYLFVISYASLFYLLAVMLFPKEMDEYDGYRDYFLSRRKWFFGILALTYLADIPDTLLKGQAYLASFGWEYPVRMAAYMVLFGIAMFTRNARFHAAFAALSLIYQISYILRLYYREG
jgi:hypothetical protein